MRKQYKWMLASVLQLVLLGCMDAARITAPRGGSPTPAPQQLRLAMAPDGHEAPVFTSISEVPEDWQAEIYDQKSYAYWNGASASGSADMRFVGNRISQTVVLTVLAGTQTVGTSTPSTHVQTSVLPFRGRIITSAYLDVSSSCGQVTNTASQHDAKLMLFAGADFITLDHERRGTQASARQPACREVEECADVTQVTYSPETPECEDGGSGGSDGVGTGIFYQPGESTGGNTVDFATGEGLSGGGSVCGAAAVVQYICIDILDSEGNWKEWGCGYVTSC